MNVLIYFQTQTQVESFQELVRRLQIEVGESVFYTLHPAHSSDLDFQRLSSHAQLWDPNHQLPIDIAYYFGDVHISMFVHSKLEAIRNDFFYQPHYPYDQSTHPNSHELKVYLNSNFYEVSKDGSEWSRERFFQDKGMTTNLPVVLWLPSPEMNTSSIPGIWVRVLDLSLEYNVVILATDGLDSFFTEHFIQLAKTHASIHFAAEEILEWMQLSDILLSDLNSHLLNYCRLDKPIVLFDNPHLLDLLNSQRGLPWFYQRDFAPRIHRARDLKSVISSQLEDPQMYSQARQEMSQKVTLHSLNFEQFIQRHQAIRHQQTKPVKWVLKNSRDMGEIQPLLNDVRVSEVILLDSQYQPTPHPKIRQLSSAEISQYQTGLFADEILVFQSAPGVLKGDWEGVVDGFAQSSFQVMSPLTVGDSRLARLQSHIKSEYYQLGAQVNIEDLVHFLKLSQKGESYSVPELDVPLLLVQAQYLLEVSQVGFRQALTSPQLAMGLAKELLFIPQN